MNLVELDKYGLTWHQKVAYLGTCIRDTGAPTPPMKLTHIFEPGVYVREVWNEAGTLLIGRPHRFGHHVRFVSGTLRLIESDGDRVIEAPYDLYTEPGHIVVFEALTDLVGRTYHPNPDECRDTDLMESVIFHPESEMEAVGRLAADRIRSLT